MSEDRRQKTEYRRQKTDKKDTEQRTTEVSLDEDDFTIIKIKTYLT
jgi:hypothetical protein